MVVSPAQAFAGTHLGRGRGCDMIFVLVQLASRYR